MHTTSSVAIERPAADVFGYIADFANNPKWQRGMQSATWTSDPPIAVGSTYDQVARFLGRDVVTSFVVTRYEPDRRITIESVKSTFPIQVTRAVEERGPTACTVTAEVSGDPSGFFRIAGPIMGPVMRRSIRSDYARLKALLEAS